MTYTDKIMEYARNFLGFVSESTEEVLLETTEDGFGNGSFEKKLTARYTVDGNLAIQTPATLLALILVIYFVPSQVSNNNK